MDTELIFKVMTFISNKANKSRQKFCFGYTVGGILNLL